VCEREVLRFMALALRKVEYVIGDRRGTGVVPLGQNGSQFPCFLSNNLGKISNLLSEDPEAGAGLHRLRRRVARVRCSAQTRALQSSSSRVSRSDDSGRVFSIISPCR
jgi:hypothetical protein